MISIATLNTIIYILYIFLTILSIFLPEYSTLFPILKIITCITLYALNFKKVKKTQNLYLIVVLLLIAFSAIWNSSEAKSVFLVCHFIIIMSIARYVKTEKILENFIIFASSILYVYFAFLAITVWGDYLNGTDLINPNSLAKFLVILSIIITTYIKRHKQTFLLQFLFVIISSYFIIMTFCRSAIIAYAFFVIATHISTFKNFVFKHRKMLIILIIIIGSIFPFVYLSAFNGKTFNGASEYLGKDLYTGRQVLWPKLFNQFSKTPLGLWAGFGTTVSLQSKSIANYHSWYLGLLFSFGIVASVLYFLQYIKSSTTVSDKNISIGFLSLAIIGITEMLTLWETTQSLMVFMFAYASSISYCKKDKDLQNVSN